MSTETERWVEAGKTLAANPAAQVLCPRCRSAELVVTDQTLATDPHLIERHMRCPRCDAYNALRLRKTQILPTESEIAGSFITRDDRTTANAEVARIGKLVDGYLEKITASTDGWSVLYKDPNDGRLWELTYPNSGAHGGGAPRLKHISRDEAAKRYSL
jgi:hypothetical protein